MILVDTSVVVDFLKGADNEKVGLFEELLVKNAPFGIAAFTYQEVLQGARDEKEYASIRKYLRSQTFYFLPESVDAYDKAAQLYYKLRRQGITVRSSIDLLIAITAIENNLYMLHNDQDFDMMAGAVKELKIFNHF